MSTAKLHCVLDADAGRHLVDVQVGNRSAWNWLSSEFHLVCSEYVYTKEIMKAKHIGRDIPRELQSLFGKSQYKLNTLERDERKLLSHWVQAEGNKGEKFSVVICHDLVRSGTSRYVVFLTNDLAARRLFLQQFFDLYPIGSLWTTWDFLFHLYIRHGQKRGGVTYESMQNAIRDLNTNMPILQEEWQPKGYSRFATEQEARLQRLQKKRQELEVLNAAMNAGL